jgi:plastocyanin
MSLRDQWKASVCVLAVVAAACGGGGTGQPAGEVPGSGAAPAPPPPLPGESTISGTITFKGTAPAPRPIRTGADPLCMTDGASLKSELLVVGPGNELQNVFVYVKDGLGDRTFQPPSAPVVIDQHGCRYTPHVFGIQVGQPLEVTNSDATSHNVHAVAKANAEFNFMQATKGKKDIRTFSTPEIMVPFKCEEHGWMNSYGGVLPHPFFAVSQPDGRFEIKGLPQGTYTIEAWHEQLGTETQTVTVDGKDSATADFAFASKT